MLVKEKAEMFLTGFVGNVHLFPVRVVVQRCCRVRRRSGTVEVTRTVVEKTAKLAQLDLVQGEVDVLTDDFVKILGFVESMNELDLDGIEPMARVETRSNVLRVDRVEAFAYPYGKSDEEKTREFEDTR
mmetsp:Transcript_4749/g.9606  ORF Transcript_4749/g.9606 Transcript_4749/m.9606 type:complete len:129 (-) Transcript_4749:1735-2121(-)